MRLGIRVAWALTGLWGPVCAQTAVECPPTLRVVQQGGDLDAPWSAVDLDEDGHHRLLAAGLFEGPPPQQRGAIRPRATEGRPGQGRFVQHFRWSTPEPGGVYLVCHFDGTTVVAHRRIEPTPRRCSLETSRGPQGFGPAVVRCD